VRRKYKELGKPFNLTKHIFTQKINSMQKRIFVLLLVFIFVMGCKRSSHCGDITPFYFHLQIGDSIRSKVPHSGYDTLVFYNQYKDTVFLIGTGVTKDKIGYKVEQNDCGYVEEYVFDIETLGYFQDSVLSNTSKPFPIKTIELNADSNNNYWIDRKGGFVISFDLTFVRRNYSFLNDKYYTENVSINAKSYDCIAFVGAPEGGALYFNHYQGIVQVIESDTIIWNRIIN
jgi:hypothetical protein